MLRACLCVAILGQATVAQAEDWPQWMGPKRDNVWRETGLVETLPSQPNFVWRVAVAGGYSGPAVANGKVYLTDFVTSDFIKTDNFKPKPCSGSERILCFDEATGKLLWSKERDETYTISYPAGPRSTPLVHQGKVYAQGAEGFLACFDASSGEVVWRKNLKETYKTKSAMWGYASQPLIDGDKLFVIAGGPGSHCVALHKDSGEEIWKTGTAPEQGYAPPLLIQQAGVRQLVLSCPDSIYAVDPQTGQVLWSQVFGAEFGSIIMTPIHSGNYLYTGGYGYKNLMLELAMDKPDAKTLWRDDVKRGVSAQNVQPFLMDGNIYGMDHSGEFRCCEIPSGKVLWSNPKLLGDRKLISGSIFLVRENETDKFWMFSETGDLIVAKLSPMGYTEFSRMHVIAPTNHAFGRDVVWCTPAFANRRMYVRNDKELVCVDLAKSSQKP